jgi:hypothetical protein
MFGPLGAGLAVPGPDYSAPMAERGVKSTRARPDKGVEHVREPAVEAGKEAIMAKKPPLPEANRSPKGTGSAPEPLDEKRQTKPENLAEEDRQGNIKQNTTNQGYQQDR